MTAFSELAVMPEVIQAIEEMDWLLPTDVQAEAIPLILGGGDVLMLELRLGSRFVTAHHHTAKLPVSDPEIIDFRTGNSAAETGSGKTGAFCLPIIQIVHETLRDRKAGKTGRVMAEAAGSKKVVMNVFDRDDMLAISPDGLLCQCREHRAWQGCRSALGVKKGRHYFEATVTDEGLCRVGWSTQNATLELGKDKFGFGFGGTGKKSFGSQFDSYGEPFGKDDTMGCYLDLDSGTIAYSKNGKHLGKAFDIPKHLQGEAFFAAVVLKNAEMQFNFGDAPFRNQPQAEYSGLTKAQGLTPFRVHAPVTSSNKHVPIALIIEPARELAQQTHDNITQFKKHLPSPGIQELLVMGGDSAKDQIRALQQGVDIVCGTPGRLDDLISTGKLDLSGIRFYVLDEADGLLTQGCRDLIMKIYNKIPQVTPEGRRLQMIVCSATLHNLEVKKLADKIMHFPTWVDLKGLDAVPETVHHVVCHVDPIADTSWHHLSRSVQTDGIHSHDKVRPGSHSPESLSEAVKLLKAEYLVKAISAHKMDQAIIFCRTKLDCDNIENYLSSLGGGPRAMVNEYSCVCLHSDRRPQERKANLKAFKEGEARFLICTDVAARGIDITGIPFVVNVTLPDDKQNYVHRIGRVGRAERMGLAISLVSKVKEKVWYHTCPSRGKSCRNTQLTDNGGCAIWYNETQYLADIEEHLGVTIPEVVSSFEVPVNEFDGKITYGKKISPQGQLSEGHVSQLAASVSQLARLEQLAQTTFLKMQAKQQKWLL